MNITNEQYLALSAEQPYLVDLPRRSKTVCTRSNIIASRFLDWSYLLLTNILKCHYKCSEIQFTLRY